MKKIKPCPFCGGHAKVHAENNSYVIKCNDCGVTGRKIYRNAGVRPCVVQNMVIDWWNKRVMK